MGTPGTYAPVLASVGVFFHCFGSKLTSSDVRPRARVVANQACVVRNVSADR